jgi:large subunit ribosomal protein L21
MYAIVEQGSKQYKVAVGDRLEIELTEVAPDATTIELDKVLFIGGGEEGSRIGKPYIEGAKVVASFAPTAAESVVKGPKLYVTIFRRRKNSQKRVGHRQKHLQVTIDRIEG